VAAERTCAAKICVAKIGAAHGTAGEVKLWSFTADPAAVKDYGPLESEDGAARFTIEALRPGKDHLVARLSGVRDRNAAERLTNLHLYVPRERLPEPQAEEFYHADLIGLAAEGLDGNAIGTVVAIHDFGAGDLLELRVEGQSSTVLIPFNTTTVPVVDVSGGRIVIDPPQGLLKAR
jgi:16S rRNA processing protein RimM